MRDALFGNISSAVTSITLSTVKTTDNYAGDYVDLGTISSSSRFTKHTLYQGTYAVWLAQSGAFNAADSMTPFIDQADNSAFSINHEKAAIFPQTALGAVQGTMWRFRVPENVREFIRGGATSQSSGASLTSPPTIYFWFEEGARMGPAL